MRRILILAAVAVLSPTAAFAQDFVTECTLETTGGEEVLCQTSGAWGTCQEAGPNSCEGENPDAPGECRGYPECQIAFCENAAVRGTKCVVAGESGECIPLCEVDFSLDCATGGQDLVCEVGGPAMDMGDEATACTASGSRRTDLSWLILAAALVLRRRQAR